MLPQSNMFLDTSLVSKQLDFLFNNTEILKYWYVWSQSARKNSAFYIMFALICVLNKPQE